MQITSETDIGGISPNGQQPQTRKQASSDEFIVSNRLYEIEKFALKLLTRKSEKMTGWMNKNWKRRQ